MEKEKWIEEVFNSTKEMQKLETSPFLFEKVSQKITSRNLRDGKIPSFNSAKSDRLKTGGRWVIGITAVLILAINILSIGKAADVKQQAAETSQEFNYLTVYSY